MFLLQLLYPSLQRTNVLDGLVTYLVRVPHSQFLKRCKRCSRKYTIKFILIHLLLLPISSVHSCACYWEWAHQHLYWNCSRPHHHAAQNYSHLPLHKWCNSAGHSLAPRPSTGTTLSAPSCLGLAPVAYRLIVAICSVDVNGISQAITCKWINTPLDTIHYLISRDFLSHHTCRVPTKSLPFPRQLPSLLSVIIEKAAQVTQLLVVVSQALICLFQDTQFCD